MTVWDRGSHRLFQRPGEHTRAEDGHAAGCRGSGNPRFFQAGLILPLGLPQHHLCCLKPLTLGPCAEPAGFPPTQCAVVTFIWALHLPLVCHHCLRGRRERLSGPSVHPAPRHPPASRLPAGPGAGVPPHRVSHKAKGSSMVTWPTDIKAGTQLKAGASHTRCIFFPLVHVHIYNMAYAWFSFDNET